MSRNLLLLLLALVVAAALLLLALGGGGRPANRGPVEPAPRPAAATPELPAAPVAAPEQPDRVRSAADAAPAANAAAAPSAGAWNARWLTMRLVDEHRQPLAGAVGGVLQMDENDDDDAQMLTLLRVVEGQPVPGFEPREAVSGPDGVLRLALTADNAQRIVAYGRRDGSAIAMHWDWQGLDQSGTDLDAGDLVLRSGASLVVRVRDEDGRALAGAYVSTLEANMDAAQGRVPWHLLQTDADGRCVFRHLARTKHNVQAQGRDYQISPPVEFDPERAAPELEIVLTRGAVLTGRVEESDGAPAAGVQLRVSPEDRDGFSLLDELGTAGGPLPTTGADGTFHCSGLRADRKYTVRAERDAAQWVEQEGVHPGDELVLRLPAPAGVSGRLLLADGMPAAGAKLAAQGADEGGSWFDREHMAGADAEGRFQLPLRAGRYRLAAWHARGEGLVTDELRVHGQTDAGTLYLSSGGTLEVTFLDAAGQPAGKVFLEEDFRAAFHFPSFESDDPAELDRRMVEYQERQKQVQLRMFLHHGRERPVEVAPGVVRWPGLAPGRHTFAARADGAAPQTFEAEIVPDQVTAVTVQLALSARLNLTVCSADGTPASGAVIGLEPQSGRPEDFVRNRNYRPVQDGRVIFDNVPPGVYEVREGYPFEDRQAALAVLNLAAGDHQAEVTLAPRYTLVVQVADADGPVADAEVRVGGRNGALRTFQEHGIAPATDGAGLAEVPRLRPGRYLVSAARPGGLPASAEVELLSDRQSVAVQLSGWWIEGRVIHAPEACEVRLERVQRLGLAPGAGSAPMPLPFDMAGMGSVQVACDAQGRFRFQDLPNGEYELRASAHGHYQEESARVTVQDAPAGNVVLTLQPEGKLIVRVTGLERFAGDGDYFARAESADGKSSGMVWFHGDGDFAIERLAPGPHTVRIRRGRHIESAPLAEFSVVLNTSAATLIEWDRSSAD